MTRKRRSPRSGWYKVDLHIHTPASNDYLEANVSYLDILRQAEICGLDIIAITDHNTVAGVRALRKEVDELQLLEQLGRNNKEEQQKLDEYRRLLDKILVLPGFELTAALGFHIIGIFSPETAIRELEHTLLTLRVPPERLDEGATAVGATVDVLTAYRVINEAGGLVVAAHANSTHGVAMQDFDFGGQTKIAYTQDPNLHVLEVTDLESRRRNRTANFFNGSKPEYPRRMHCIQGSDAHRLQRDSSDKNRLGIGDRITEVRLSEPTFEALKALFTSHDFANTRPFRASQTPYDHVLASRQQGANIIQTFYPSMAQRGGYLDSILCDICAFANTNGGTVYVGVSANPNEPAVGITKIKESSNTIKTEVDKRIIPPLDVQVETQETQGKKVLQINVSVGKQPPYVLDESQIYVRDETDTNLAVRDEIISLVKRTLQVKEPPVLIDSDDNPPPQNGSSPSSSKSNGIPGSPTTGVEIAFKEERKGKTYYSLRDLRNGNLVHNVTKKSARRLWQYAINEYENNHNSDLSHVTWQGNIGLLKVQHRGDQVRFDCVQRDDDGTIHIYYGVTYDGIDGPWEQLLESVEETSTDGKG